MPTVWFVLVAIMLTAYVVLDGFDLGAGVIHLFIAKGDSEKRLVLRAIGPVWDGNEVWLIASGGTLFFAFPLLYASSFSGFYLPLNIVLWLLILRAIGIEFRLHLENRIWREFFGGWFSIGSALLTIFYGAALGNVIRGVPLDKEGYFFAPLWTNFRVGREPGILDWYTVIAGVLAFVALALHGAHYLAMKTEGELTRRTRNVARLLWPALVILTFLSLVATLYVRPQVLDNYKRYPVGYLIPLAVVVSLALMFVSHRTGKDHRAFAASCIYLVAMLVGAAYALYPTLLPATTDPAYNITIDNAAAGHYSLSYGIIWWTLGMLIAIGYFVLIYWMFRGKVRAEEGHGY